MSALSEILDMEDDVLAADEMAEAVYIIVERMALADKTSTELQAALRCVSHLQSHTRAAVTTWRLAATAAGAGLSRAA